MTWLDREAAPFGQDLWDQIDAVAIHKAPALQDGAVVVMRSASGPRIVIGQDLAAAYDGHEGVFHQLSLVESVGLVPGVPGSVAVLRGATRT